MARFVLDDLTSHQQRRFEHLEEVALAAVPLEDAGHEFVIWSLPGSVGAGADVTSHLEKIRSASREVNQVRGDFLAAMILLEDQIEDTIFYYFEPGASSEFSEWILSPMPFARKLVLLRNILKRVALWGTYSDDWLTIDGLRGERNKMAHLAVWFERGSITVEDGNYRLRRGPAGRERPEPATTMSDLRDWLKLAETTTRNYPAIHKAICEAHTDPRDEFIR